MLEEALFKLNNCDRKGHALHKNQIILFHFVFLKEKTACLADPLINFKNVLFFFVQIQEKK